MDEDARCHYQLRCELSDINEFVYFRDSDLRRSGHHGLKIASALVVDEVAVAIGAQRAKQGEITAER